MGQQLREDYRACGDWVDDLDDGDIYLLMGDIDKFDEWLQDQDVRNEASNHGEW